MSTLAERLTYAFDKAKEVCPFKSKAGLARHCNVKPPSVTDWFNGKTKSLSYENAIKAAEYLEINVQWLLGRDTDIHSQSVGVVYEGSNENEEKDLIAIPEYEITFGAGSHPDPTFSEISESVKAYYRPEWFARRGINPDNCKRFKVSGCSMEPMIWDGDTILVDCKPQKIVAGRVYAFGHGGEMKVKILYPMLDGSIVVKSYNPEVKDEQLLPCDLSSFVLIGRVRDRSGGEMF